MGRIMIDVMFKATQALSGVVTDIVDESTWLWTVILLLFMSHPPFLH